MVNACFSYFNTTNSSLKKKNGTNLQSSISSLLYSKGHYRRRPLSHHDHLPLLHLLSSWPLMLLTMMTMLSFSLSFRCFTFLFCKIGLCFGQQKQQVEVFLFFVLYLTRSGRFVFQRRRTEGCNL